MRLLFLGDVMGRTGRAAICETLPRLRTDWRLDFVVVNGENASSGHGLSQAHAQLLLKAGIDCLTLGDHAFDQRDMLQFIDKEPRILRPLNYAKSAPGRGAQLFSAAGRRKVLVAQALGQVFMKRPFSDPFSALEGVLRETAARVGVAHRRHSLVQKRLTRRVESLEAAVEEDKRTTESKKLAAAFEFEGVY